MKQQTYFFKVCIFSHINIIYEINQRKNMLIFIPEIYWICCSLLKAKVDLTLEWSIWEDHSDFKPEAGKKKKSEFCWCVPSYFVEKKSPPPPQKGVPHMALWKSEHALNISEKEMNVLGKLGLLFLKYYHFLRNTWQHNVINFKLLSTAMWIYHCHLWDVLQVFLSLTKPQIHFVPS